MEPNIKNNAEEITPTSSPNEEQKSKALIPLLILFVVVGVSAIAFLILDSRKVVEESPEQNATEEVVANPNETPEVPPVPSNSPQDPALIVPVVTEAEYADAQESAGDVIEDVQEQVNTSAISPEEGERLVEKAVQNLPPPPPPSIPPPGN